METNEAFRSVQGGCGFVVWLRVEEHGSGAAAPSPHHGGPNERPSYSRSSSVRNDGHALQVGNGAGGSDDGEAELFCRWRLEEYG